MIMANRERSSGLILHPTSLPGRFGVGNLGPAAFEFVDFLSLAGQKRWQILPLCPPGEGNSPYSAYSAFAGNPILISPEKLVDDGLLAAEDLADVPEFSTEFVEFDRVTKWKSEMLAKAFEAFRAGAAPQLTDEFEYFCKNNAWWLDDYSLFRALKSSHSEKAWFQWAEPLRSREPAAIATVLSQLAREIQTEKFSQYLFFRQWFAVRRYANERGIKIVGDLPIFVALDSADVWCNQRSFKLKPDGSPTVVAGVPPDYFSKTGQLWGNPIYNWEAMLKDDFGWWTARLAFNYEIVDIVRLDHFIGFIRNWEVPGGDETAENGKWSPVPGQMLFRTLLRRLGPFRVIAEDLGAMTAEVEALRDDFGFPGMRILQFAFGGDEANSNLPHNYIPNSVVYTGTHDNDTTAGWWRSISGKKKGWEAKTRKHCLEYLQTNGREMHWEMIRAAWASVAETAIVPLQDVFGLDNKHRMNLPASTDGNWKWRLADGALTPEIADRLRQLTELYGRLA